MRRLFFCALALALVPAVALAHPMSQGSLDVELAGGDVVVHARVPIEEVLLASRADTLEEARREHGDYLLAHLHVAADGRGLAGAVEASRDAGPEHAAYDLRFAGAGSPHSLRFSQDVLAGLMFAPGNPWEASFAVTVRRGGQVLAEGRPLTSREPLEVGGVPAGRTMTFLEYLRHGVEHILGGYDHLLFVAALAVAAASLWDLLQVVGVFTLAHSVTLTLAVLGLVHLPARVVEPMIAASIVLVAVVNVAWPEKSRGRTRLATAFFFGLFHGLGFAGGLLDAMSGLSGASAWLAIAGFSLGVECGHQLVVLPIFAARRFARSALPAVTRDAAAWRARLPRLASAAISVAGSIYLVAALR